MRSPALALPAVLLASGLAAQQFVAAPSGYDNVEGNSNNTIPWWSLSAAYQQVHDGVDLQNVFGPVAVIRSINFRKESSNTQVTGRSMDLQITLGATPVTAGTASSIFANNLGPAPQVVLPMSPVNLPPLTHVSTPNPIGWSFPFTVPFTYTPAPGNNLCWEIRFTNGTDSSVASMDAVERLNATTLPNVGIGCVASGQTQAATIGLRSLSMLTGLWRNRLDFAATNAPAVQIVGLGQQTVPLPGFCSTVETLPLVTLPGSTDAAGQWDSQIPFGSLLALPQFDLVAQFGFLDAGLPNSIGLSDASLIRTPPSQNRHVSRIWFGTYQSGNGNENASSGNAETSYGLVTIFGL